MYKIESIENQKKAILPMNSISATIFYNQRFLISAPIPEPLAWRLTKVEDISPKGVRRLTFAADTYNQHTDYVEKDEFGNVIGLYADYFLSSIQPTPVNIDTPTTLTSSITCSGKQQLKVGGSAKTLTVVFYDENGEPTDYQSGEWSYEIDDADASEVLTVTTVSDEKIKVKFNGDDTYINKILKVTFTAGDIISTLDLEILPL